MQNILRKKAPKIEIQTSSISGKGTFAKEPIAIGEYITTLAGETIPAKTHREICVERGMSEDDPLQISDDEFLILNYESKVINHSCNPNAGIRNISDLYAIRDISAGEEITYDYSTTVAVTDPWTMDCHCGASNCRKKIGNVLSIPQATLDRYIRLNALPEFIQQQLKKIGYKPQDE